MKTTPYHVYADDGFESAHRTEAAAIRAAKAGARRRKMAMTVVKCSAAGYTGGGHGTDIVRIASNGTVSI